MNNKQNFKNFVHPESCDYPNNWANFEPNSRNNTIENPNEELSIRQNHQKS